MNKIAVFGWSAFCEIFQKHTNNFFLIILWSKKGNALNNVTDHFVFWHNMSLDDTLNE